MAGPRRSIRWKATAVWASAALNIVLIGLLVGRAAFPPGPPPPPHEMVDHLAGELDAADRAAFLAAFAPRRTALRDRGETLHGLFEAFSAEMVREPFDPDAFRAAKDRLEAGRTALEAIVVEAMVEAFTHVSPEGRERLSRFPPPPPHPPQ